MKRSKYNLSHQLLTDTDFGWLTPILVEDVLPGDTWKIKSEVFVKAIPLLAPIMDKVDIRVDYFFVPNRILWSKWQDFITGGRLGTVDIKEPSLPLGDQFFMASPDSIAMLEKIYQCSLAEVANSDSRHLVSALPLLAYNKIYADWYMDLNVETDEYVSTTPTIDGSSPIPFGTLPDSTQILDANGVWRVQDVNTKTYLDALLVPKQRKFRKDVFTSALPWPQRGPEVGFDIPPGSANADLDGDVNFELNDKSFRVNQVYQGSTNVEFTDTNGEAGHTEGYFGIQGQGQFTNIFGNLFGVNGVNIERGSLGSITIRELRRLSALQAWFERNARFGSRYIEQILSHFGVHTPDYRLQRSEYLGGTISPLQVSETYQTAVTGNEQQETADVLGQFAGHLTSYGVNGVRKFRANEHGWIFGLMSIVPRTSYGQGIQRRFTRRNRLDYAFPEFAAIGEQSVLSKELYFQGDENANNKVFGYNSRYYEYKSRQDRFSAAFKNIFPWWHLGRIFADEPKLSLSFLEARSFRYDSEYDRIFAYTPNPDEHDEAHFHFLCQCNHHIRVKRPIPKYVNSTI